MRPTRTALSRCLLLAVAAAITGFPGVYKSWDWKVDAETGKPRRTLRVCFCKDENFDIGASKLHDHVRQALDNVDSRCENTGKACTKATEAADCGAGGKCAGDKGPWKFVPSLTLDKCPELGKCAADQPCDVIIRVDPGEGFRGGGAATQMIFQDPDKRSVMECMEQRFSRTPTDNSGRCTTVPGGLPGKKCTPIGGACPGAEKCWNAYCDGGDKAGKACNDRRDCPGDGAKCLKLKTSWGTEGDTLDPVSVESHELSHKARQTHQNAQSDTGSFEQPVTPGNHQRKPSAQDLKAGETSAATAFLPPVPQPVGPSGAVLTVSPISTGDTFVQVVIPPGALASTTSLVVAPLIDRMLPFPAAVPEPYLAVFAGVSFGVAPFLGRPATVTIAYADFRVADLETPLDERTLALFVFDTVRQEWIRQSRFTLDTVAHKLTFETHLLSQLTFAIGGERGPLPVLCDVDGDGDIDRADISVIFAARNTRVTGLDPRDPDADHVLTPNDARICTLKCTKPLCTQ